MGNEWHWQGASGVWYKHLIWDLSGSLASIPANYILVRRAADGTRRALYIGETADLGGGWRAHAASGLLDKALDLGAAEIHLHCSGRDQTARAAIETDLRRAHDAPLNRRPARARQASTPLSLAGADPIVELANLLNARSASTGKQTPLWA